MTRVLSPGTDWLEEHLAEWVDAGLVDEAQCDAIAAFEHGRVEMDVGPAPRLGIGAEVAAYLGSVLALTGGAVAIGESWEGLPFPARLALGLAITAVGLVIGRWLFRFGEPGTDRLGGFVTSLGVGGIALTTGLLVDEIDPSDRAWIPFAIGALVFAASVLLWRNRDRPMQLASAVLGGGIAGAALTDLLGERWWVAGLVFIGAGGLLSLLGHLDRVRPPFIALVSGGVLAYVGAHMLADLNEHLGSTAALLVALVYVLYAVRTGLTTVLVLAIAGATVASSTLLSTTFDSALSAFGVAVIGLAVVAAVVVRSVGRAPR